MGAVGNPQGEKYFPYTKNLTKSVSINGGWVIDAIFEQGKDLFILRLARTVRTFTIERYGK